VIKLEKILDVIFSYKTDLVVLLIVSAVYAGYKIFSAVRKGKNKNDNGQNT
jgi:hypothetical protein